MLDYLIGLATRLGHWGYGIVALGAMLESAAFIGLFVPGESMVVVAGFLAGQGVFDLDVLIVAVAIGATLGDNIGYELGRHLGRPWAARFGYKLGLTESRLARAEAFFSRHGGKAIFLGRFVGFARALVPFIAGSARMRYATFSIYNALGAALWSLVFTLLGYFLGQAAQAWVGKATAVLGAVVFVAIVLLVISHWVVEHERELRTRWERVKQARRVAQVLARFAPQIEWLRRRLSPGQYFGLQLTFGVLIFVSAAWLFAGITRDVLAGDPLTVVDRNIALWLYRRQEPALTAVMAAIGWLHTWPLAIAGLLLLAHFVWARRWRWAVIAICARPADLQLSERTYCCGDPHLRSLRRAPDLES